MRTLPFGVIICMGMLRVGKQPFPRGLRDYVFVRFRRGAED